MDELKNEIEKLQKEINVLDALYLIELKTCQPKKIIWVMANHENEINPLHKKMIALKGSLIDEQLAAINKKIC